MGKLNLKYVTYIRTYKVFITILLLLFSTLLPLLQSCSPPPSGLEGKKVLVFTENGEGYVHDNIQASVDMFLKFAEDEHFTLHVNANSAIFATPDLQTYDVIVLSNTNNDVFDSQEERDGLVKFVRSGKGVLGVHIACGMERDWDWFKQMIGGTFDFHPQLQEFPVWVVDSLHPSVAGIPSPWLIKDELYVMKEMNPTVHVLMVSDFSSPDFIPAATPMPNTFGKVFPCVWWNTFDGGRQWFSALGHLKEYYSDPVLMRHYLEGLKWLVSN
ncbi:MAG: ThuA domain-containing protein [Tannerella sp.]|jgi:type 1 glutamine amidotransferase|nr:ThuA domain-containing protein [Tannerella sp.]